jgi:hypothetical protein
LGIRAASVGGALETWSSTASRPPKVEAGEWTGAPLTVSREGRARPGARAGPTALAGLAEVRRVGGESRGLCVLGV